MHILVLYVGEVSSKTVNPIMNGPDLYRPVGFARSEEQQWTFASHNWIDCMVGRYQQDLWNNMIPLRSKYTIDLLGDIRRVMEDELNLMPRLSSYTNKAQKPSIPPQNCGLLAARQIH